MNYAGLNDTIVTKVMAAMAIINNPEVAPDVRQRNQEILFEQVGSAVYAKVYSMNAYDMEITHTTGPGIDDRHYGLAKVASASVSAGVSPMPDLVRNYLDNMAGLAQRDAMHTAKQSGKHPTVVRTPTGRETCSWCDGKAGTYTNPGREVFARHRGCDCKIETSGFHSRNGTLNNYVAK